VDHAREASLSVPNEPSGVGQARRFTEARLAEWGLQEVADITVLLVSEAVTNALLHTGASPLLRLGTDDDRLRVEVMDASPVMPAVRNFGEIATTGRGLQLIDALAARWGTETAAGGKVVWFEMPADGGAGLTAEGAGSRRGTGGRRCREEPWHVADRVGFPGGAARPGGWALAWRPGR
jgi:anti-sigma regulatory factor (Ser/Thr protein kinase)